MELNKENCVACKADSPLVTEAEVAELHPLVAEWEFAKEGSVSRLRRSFTFHNFAQALEFTLRVGEAAEEEGHHPLIATEWGRVTVNWWTHKIKGLHHNDFIMAAKTDRAYAISAGPG